MALFWRVLDVFWAPFCQLITIGGSMNVYSLVAAIVFAMLIVPIAGGQAFHERFTPTLKAILPQKLLNHPSIWLDLKILYVNSIMVIAAGSLFGLSSEGLRNAIATIFGHIHELAPPIAAAPAGLSIALTFFAFIGFEFGFWIAHWLSHRIFFLWKFHELHHSAELLTPASAARVHPVETLFTVAIQASVVAIFQFLVFAFLGKGLVPYSLFGRNIIMFVAMNTIDHLRHSHLWLPFNGWLGRIFISPAHHQLHHSQDVEHQMHNYGLTIAIFDTLFGTLEIPPKEPKQNFGVHSNPYADNKLRTALKLPFEKIFDALKNRLGRGRPSNL